MNPGVRSLNGIRPVRLGSTGLKVARLCLGAMTYGDPAWRSWVQTEEAGRPFIKRALETASISSTPQRLEAPYVPHRVSGI